MKKIRLILAMFIIFSIAFFSNNIFALTSTDLISVGSGDYAITVTKDTTVEQIEAVLGKAKVVTDSAFGGKAYSFYTDDEYNNFLYIETLSDGKIISYGSVDPTYKTNTYSYGTSYNYRENGALHGCLFNNNSVVQGGVYYNKYAYIKSSYTETIDFFTKNYESNPTYYLKGLSKQSVTMYNALSTRLGNKTNLVFDEDMFYINEQFKEFDTSIRNYLSEMDKSNYMKAIGIKEGIEISNSIYYVLNPMVFASLAKNNKSANFGEKTIAIMDYDINKKLVSAITVSPDVFKRYDSISLTQEEQSKLSSGRHEYEQAIYNLNLDSELYDVEPQSTNVSTLVAGELKASKKQGITDYVNAIRVAAGLPKLKINDDAFLVAQHISTLISYRYTELGLPITHMPEQPDGLSDEYYNIAIGYGRGYAENLGYSATASTVSIMMYHINLFLDDSSESPQNFSHRAKVLDPDFTDFGYGISPYTFSNEFTGYKANDVFLEAWPAEGITFLESLVSKRFQWTAQFVDKYKITDTTTVSVKCLNTDTTWNFTTEEKTSTRWFQRYTKAIQSLNNKVVFYDNTIVPEQGYVYEITIYNLLNEDTNTVEDYTYRSVFEYADVDNYPTSLSSIKIVTDSLSKVKDEDVYYVPVGKETKVSVEIDSTVVDKKITWISSNDKVKVTQNGTIIAESLVDEDVTITVSYDGSNVTDEIVVRPYNKIEQVKLENDSLNLLIDKYDTENKDVAQNSIEYLPIEANEETEITWKIARSSNLGVEYDINDSYIRKYLAVDIVDNNPMKINIKAVSAEPGDNKFKIISHVQGLTDEYIGSCEVEITVALNNINIKNANSYPLTISSASIEDPEYCVINYNDFYKSTNSNIIKFSVDYDPDNTTVNKDIVWSTETPNIITDYDKAGSFRIDKEGNAVIVIENKESGKKGYLYLTINSTLESLSIKGSSSNIKLKSDSNGNYTATDTLVTTKYPTIDDDVIVYSSSNKNIATVDSNGKVTFLKAGTVTITATSKSNSSIKSTYTYNVSIPVESLDFTIAKQTKVVTKGESIQNQAVCLPTNTTYSKYVTYSSSNTGVATVDSNGTVKAVGNGTAVITSTINGAYTSSGETISSSYYIKVITPVESITTTSSLDIVLEESVPQPTVTINPSNYTDTVTIKWQSNNTSILTINSSNGKITPLKSGKTTIKVTVTAKNDNGTTTFTNEIPVTVRSVNDPKYEKGDLDKNGVINANDAAIALDLYKYGGADDIDLQIGDMDDNGVINANDAALILDIYKYGQ